MTNSEFLTSRIIELRFFKCFFPLWKIVKNSVVSNDDFFVMGDDNVKRKKYFPKDNGLSWKAFRNENVDERGGSSSNFFFFKNVTFLTLVTRNNKRSTSTDFFWEKKQMEFSIERHGIFSGLFLYISFQY